MGRRRPRIGITLNLETRQRRTLLLVVDALYGEAIAAAGGTPCLLEPLAQPRLLAEYAGFLDGLLLSGGGDLHPRYYGEKPRGPLQLSHPRRDAFETALVRRMLRLGKPVLGICYGMQLLNVVLGGSLLQHLAEPSLSRHRAPGKRGIRRHRVRLAPGSRLHRALGQPALQVASSHHQAVNTLGQGLVAAAWAPDGVVEAVEHARLPFVVGVQWHPEKTPRSRPTRRLMAAFVRACLETSP